MSKEITLERLAEAIIKTRKEVMALKAELEKVQAYLREQQKLKNLNVLNLIELRRLPLTNKKNLLKNNIVKRIGDWILASMILL
jgi:hypothetical protein